MWSTFVYYVVVNFTDTSCEAPPNLDYMHARSKWPLRVQRSRLSTAWVQHLRGDIRSRLSSAADTRSLLSCPDEFTDSLLIELRCSTLWSLVMFRLAQDRALGLVELHRSVTWKYCSSSRNPSSARTQYTRARAITLSVPVSHLSSNNNLA